MISEAPWLHPLTDACRYPWRVAERWRAGGGKVVGVFGHFAPRELVHAGGLLPIRLRPTLLTPGASRLMRPEWQDDLDGLRAGLPAGAAELLTALLGGGLGWIDALIIGRDADAHTRLFYVLRELADDPVYGALLPDIAFSDLLRLPYRTSAVYNRVRLRELRERISEWAGRDITDADVAAAVSDANLTAELLRELDQLRLTGAVSGHQALIAAGAATVLPGDELRAALIAGLDQTVERDPNRTLPRVFLTGSDIYDLNTYSALERAGLAIVGEDHGWGDDGRGYAKATADPIDGLTDRYQFCTRAAARSGLERAGTTARLVRERRADALIQLVLPQDEAPGWELAELTALLPGTPVVSIKLEPDSCDEQMRDVAASVFSELRRAGRPAASDRPASV
jgi:benzoyl-CoA reductase/2-hydroxyglutaryl-CoA dehydratase subunit BcrC/BadD/HgdB